MDNQPQAIVRKYEDLMQEYCDRVVPGFWKYIDDNRRKYGDFLKRLFDFYLFGSYLADAGLFKGRQKGEKPLKVLYATAAISYFGVYSCLGSGCLPESAVVIRHLFEILVNLKLILDKDTDERLKLYRNYRFVSQWLDTKTNPDHYDMSERRLIENRYKNIMADYHPKIPRHWAWKLYSKELPPNRNPTLRFICSKLGLGDDYNRVYSVLSKLVHADPQIDHVVVLNDKITTAPIYSDVVYDLGLLSLYYFMSVIDPIVKYYEYDEPDHIHIYISQFLLDLNRKYRRKMGASENRK